MTAEDFEKLTINTIFWMTLRAVYTCFTEYDDMKDIGAEIWKYAAELHDKLPEDLYSKTYYEAQIFSALHGLEGNPVKELRELWENNVEPFFEDADPDGLNEWAAEFNHRLFERPPYFLAKYLRDENN